MTKDFTKDEISVLQSALKIAEEHGGKSLIEQLQNMIGMGTEAQHPQQEAAKQTPVASAASDITEAEAEALITEGEQGSKENASALRKKLPDTIISYLQNPEHSSIKQGNMGMRWAKDSMYDWVPGCFVVGDERYGSNFSLSEERMRHALRQTVNKLSDSDITIFAAIMSDPALQGDKGQIQVDALTDVEKESLDRVVSVFSKNALLARSWTPEREERGSSRNMMAQCQMGSAGLAAQNHSVEGYV